MFNSIQQKENEGDSAAAIDIAPLIDIVFILLIFFLTTTTLLKDRAIRVNRPQAATGETMVSNNLRIVVPLSGSIFMEGKRVDAREGSRQVERFLNRFPEGRVILVPDQDTPAKYLVAAMDMARSGGARQLAVATREPTDQ